MDWQFELLYQIIGGITGTILSLCFIFFIFIKIYGGVTLLFKRWLPGFYFIK